jgi:hypothetical protein
LTLSLEQVKGLYKGLSPPLALTGFTNAVMFAINSQMKKIVASFKRDPTSPLTLPQVRGSAQLHSSCKLNRRSNGVHRSSSPPR